MSKFLKRKKKKDKIIDTNSSEPKRTFTTFDLNSIKFLTIPQQRMAELFTEDQNLFVYGSAGTGKTFVGLYLALSDIFDDGSPRNKVLIIRSSVPSRDMGFLPGTLEEKLEVYETPYIDLCDGLMKYKKSYKNMKKLGYIEFISSSYVRGLSFDDVVILVDESSNMTFHELDSIITRVGRNSKIIFCGDSAQSDLTKNSDKHGWGEFKDIIQRMPEFSMVEFKVSDIVRSGLVKSYLTKK